MEFKHLLAKSCADPDNPPDAATLVGHTKAVLASFQVMFGDTETTPSLFGRQWLSFFKLTDDDFPSFWQNGLLACLFHDLGKANHDFQNMVRGRRGGQLVRHEHLGAVFLMCPEMREWFRKSPGVSQDLILSAMAGHHLKTAPRNKDFADYLPGTDRQRFSVSPSGVAAAMHGAIPNHPLFRSLPLSLSIPEK